MNMSEFAKKALEWEELTRKANAIAEELQTATTELGKTQTIGNVRISYSKGRGKYDYEQAWVNNGFNHPEVELKVTRVYDYTAACKEAELNMEDYYRVVSGPSATIKLLD